MTTKALLFSVDTYDRWDTLEKMNDQERYDLAVQGYEDDPDEVRILSLHDLQEYANDEYIDLTNWWLYIVNV